MGNPTRGDDCRALARLNDTVSEVLAAHDGVRPVEQGEGDSFVTAFARASDAVACALDLQRAPLARIRDLAHGGQTVLSGATEAMVIDRLPDGVWLTDLGSYPLRGVPRPERVLREAVAHLTQRDSGHES